LLPRTAACIAIGLGCNTQEDPQSHGPTAEDCATHVQTALAAQQTSVDSPRGRSVPLDEAKAALIPRSIEAKSDQDTLTLSEREAAVAAQEEDLRVAKAEIEATLLELEAVRDETRTLLGAVDEDREERVTRLYKMLENMRPAQAAAVLEDTPEPVALEVLMRMNQAKAGRALAAMEPEKAGVLAEKLGGAALGD